MFCIWLSLNKNEQGVSLKLKMLFFYCKQCEMEEIHVNISISQWQIIHDAIFFKSLSSFYSLELENFLQFEIIDLCMNSLLKFIPLSLVVFFFRKN